MSDSDVVIRVEGLGKKYSLHHEQGERYTALRDVVARQARAAGRLLNPFTLAGQLRKAQRHAAQERADSEEEFWALKDVSFEIRRGERVGIIGRNGAGKSTLLKILSRITEPTTGRVEIRGQVASLLEVGTGFHPELTGRENIYLNGAILGMTRWEIRSKFDEIVDFAEVEKFLDTPVKRYSSGMYVRLAFAVAAHLEPEILVVDEVLAVGDRGFQAKCLDKMQSDSNKEGKTVIFVSHQLEAVRALCQRGILLNGGNVQADGSVQNALAIYADNFKDKVNSYYKALPGTSETKSFYIEEACMIAKSNKDFKEQLRYSARDEEIACRIKVVANKCLIGSIVYIGARRDDGTFLGYTFDVDNPVFNHLLSSRKPGTYELVVTLPSILRPGRYSLEIGTGIMNSDQIDHVQDCLSFRVTDPEYPVYSIQRDRPGTIFMNCLWTLSTQVQ